MRTVKNALGLAVLAVAAIAVWQVGRCEVANIELRDDLKDLASQAGARVGLSRPVSDEELRSTVIHKAAAYDIELNPDQVVIEHMGSGQTSTLYLAVTYSVPVNLPGLSFSLQFTPSTGRTLQAWRSQ